MPSEWNGMVLETRAFLLHDRPPPVHCCQEYILDILDRNPGFALRGQGVASVKKPSPGDCTKSRFSATMLPGRNGQHEHRKKARGCAEGGRGMCPPLPSCLCPRVSRFKILLCFKAEEGLAQRRRGRGEGGFFYFSKPFSALSAPLRESCLFFVRAGIRVIGPVLVLNPGKSG
jgi:hypothetical protein